MRILLAADKFKSGCGYFFTISPHSGIDLPLYGLLSFGVVWTQTASFIIGLCLFGVAL